jgi:hypothetical protein
MTTEPSLPPPAPPAPLPPAAPARQTSALALTSLICGILGWTLLPFLGSLAAVICGHMARAEIRREPTLDGDGMAVAGLVLGWVSIGLTALAIVAVVVIILFAGGLAAFLASTAG